MKKSAVIIYLKALFLNSIAPAPPVSRACFPKSASTLMSIRVLAEARSMSAPRRIWSNIITSKAKSGCFILQRKLTSPSFAARVRILQAILAWRRRRWFSTILLKQWRRAITAVLSLLRLNASSSKDRLNLKTFTSPVFLCRLLWLQKNPNCIG